MKILNIWDNILLIGSGEVVNVSIINQNVSDDYISYAIRDTQNIDLQAIIGTALLNKIKELVYNKIKGLENSISDDENAAYNELLEGFIKPYLTHMCVCNVLIPISFKVRNMGVIKTTSTNIQNADMDDIKYLMEYYNNQASFYETRLSKFLCTYKSAFPELDENTEAWMTSPLVGKSFATTSLFLGSENKNNCGCNE